MAETSLGIVSKESFSDIAKFSFYVFVAHEVQKEV